MIIEMLALEYKNIDWICKIYTYIGVCLNVTWEWTNLNFFKTTEQMNGTNQDLDKNEPSYGTIGAKGAETWRQKFGIERFRVSS